MARPRDTITPAFLVRICALLGACLLTAIAPVQAAPADLSSASAVVKKLYTFYFHENFWLDHVDEVRPLFDPDFFAMLRDSRWTLTDSRDFPHGFDRMGYDVDLLIASQGGAIGFSLGTPATRGSDVLVPVILTNSIGHFRYTVTADVRRNPSGAYVVFDAAGARENLVEFLKLTGANRAAALAVQNYYALWNLRDYASMYALLSKRYQSVLPYAGYPKSHSFTDTITVVTMPDSDASQVRFQMYSRDHDERGKSSTLAFTGTWHLVQENGSWKLDHEDLHAVN